MLTKQGLLKFAQKEFATTLKALKAFPAERKDYRPHERSSDVLQLISTFVFEMYLFRMYLFGDALDRSVFKTYKRNDVQDVIQDFENECEEVIAGLERLQDEDLKKSVNFAGHSFDADEFAVMMICDQIHHRGQLSVYIRMAGGKVPSIYGASADDPSTNF